MAGSQGTDGEPEEDMIPVEREGIAERASGLAEVEGSEFLSTGDPGISVWV
jgi:hypothetical protein